eukprot:2318385-Prorocentrum_lima.AAC.1
MRPPAVHAGCRGPGGGTQCVELGAQGNQLLLHGLQGVVRDPGLGGPGAVRSTLTAGCHLGLRPVILFEELVHILADLIKVVTPLGVADLADLEPSHDVRQMGSQDVEQGTCQQGVTPVVGSVLQLIVVLKELLDEFTHAGLSGAGEPLVHQVLALIGGLGHSRV